MKRGERDTLILNRKLLLELEDLYTKYKSTNNNSTKTDISYIYSERLGIGKSPNIDKKAKLEDIKRVYNYITTDEFINKYGREFTIADLYLTSNLQVEDLVKIENGLINKDEYLKFKLFLTKSLSNIFTSNMHAFNTTLSIKAILSKFYSPAQNKINDMKKQNFSDYYNINASFLDVAYASDIMTELNETYGLKVDDISFYLILESVVSKNENSYFEVAEDHKELLDKYTHVAVRCIPQLTRREINK